MCTFVRQRVQQSLLLAPPAQTLPSRGASSHVDPGLCRILGITSLAQAVSEPQTSPPVCNSRRFLSVPTWRPGAVCLPSSLTQSARSTNTDKWTRGRGRRQIPGAQHANIQMQFCCVFLGRTKMLRGALDRQSRGSF